MQYSEVSTNGKSVNTQSDCDAVINKICNAVDTMVKNSQPPQGLTHVEKSCEGHLLVGSKTHWGPLNYSICVDKYQGIAETCMLIDEEIKNHASDGQQAGVLHVCYNPLSLPHFIADESEAFDALMSGYMMGATGTWLGYRKNADCVQANGTLRAGC